MLAQKKPVVVEVMQFTPDTCMDVYSWVEKHVGSFDPDRYIKHGIAPDQGVSIDPRDGSMLIATWGFMMKVSFGDYVIKGINGINGEFDTCKPDIFDKTYDIIESRKAEPESAGE